MTRTVFWLTLGCVVGIAFTSMASVNSYLALGRGASSGADQPIQVTSQKLSVSYGEGSVEATYAGNVKVKQGDVTLSCDRLLIDYEIKGARLGQTKRDPSLARDAQTIDNMRSITALGNVKIVQGDRMAVAGKAVFDHNKRTIELTDNPMLWQGRDRLHGQKIVFYIDKHRADVNEQVSVTISSGKSKKEQEK